MCCFKVQQTSTATGRELVNFPHLAKTRRDMGHPYLWVVRGLAFGFCFVGLAAGQQIGVNKAAGDSQPFTVSVKSQLVVETVVAKDKLGNFIPGLTARDFNLTEDGVAQTIRFCEHQALTGNAAPVPIAAQGSEQVKTVQATDTDANCSRTCGRRPLPQSPPDCALLRHVRDATAGSASRPLGGTAIRPYTIDHR